MNPAWTASPRGGADHAASHRERQTNAVGSHRLALRIRDRVSGALSAAPRGQTLPLGLEVTNAGGSTTSRFGADMGSAKRFPFSPSSRSRPSPLRGLAPLREQTDARSIPWEESCCFVAHLKTSNGGLHCEMTARRCL
jgi:hypothetical protein